MGVLSASSARCVARDRRCFPRSPCPFDSIQTSRERKVANDVTLLYWHHGTEVDFKLRSESELPVVPSHRYTVFKYFSSNTMSLASLAGKIMTSSVGSFIHSVDNDDDIIR
jgi:hypothetical protein